MKNRTITAPEGAQYITAEMMKDLPEKYVLSKGITGCGATTWAIEKDGHAIIAVPFIGLVQNKISQPRHAGKLLGIHGDMDREKAIKAYLEDHPTIKIITTYDSLPAVCLILEEQGIDVYHNIHLVIDEWHILFQAYLFRGNAVKALLRFASNFDKLTFISATPIERKYWLKELTPYPEVKIEWPNAVNIIVKSRMEPDTLKYMASICRERISKGGESNYHIFINSVKGIARIITRAGLKQEDVRIVCSTSGDSHARNLAILPVGFKIEKTTDPVKTINFYTSTCFEGQDIYDEIGRTFVVSDKYTNHTKLDISTTLLQICGRIRDSRFKNEITQIFSTSRYTNVSFDEFVKSIRKKYLEAKQDAACLNGLTADRKRKMISRILRSGEPYLDVRDDQIIVDENVAKLEIINFKIVNGQYATKTNMVIALTNTGLLVEDAEEAPEDIEGSKTVVSRTTFKDAFLQYCKLRKAQPKFCFGKNLEMEQIEAAKPMVKQAYEELGEEEVKKMDYHVSNIKRALVAKMNMTTEYKIVRIINDSIPRLVAVPVNEAKKKLQETYDSLNLIRNAKATDLAEWYDIDMVQRKMEDKNVRCVIIKSAKVKFGI